MVDIAATLIHWYAENKRELPWRETTDPYRIWISEIILQQTRVVQGLEYFNRFMLRFPDVRALAEAPGDEVMKYWQGLGYYSRARNLHAAAKEIVEKFGGEFPPQLFRCTYPERDRGIYGGGYLLVCLEIALCCRGWECLPGIGPDLRYRYPYRQ